MCYLRDRPSEGGIVERPFGTTRAFALKLETEKFSLEEAKANSRHFRGSAQSRSVCFTKENRKGTPKRKTSTAIAIRFDL